MPFPFDKYPWVNFHELNLAYFIKHFREIFQQWDELYNGMLEWKADTEEELETWKNGVMDAIDNWEHDFSAEIQVWQQETEADLANWKTTTLAALDAWKTAAEATFEAIRVQAAGSASAAAQSAADAETARAAAATAQAAAEAAAAGVSASLAQIQTNTENIADLKTALLQKFRMYSCENLLDNVSFRTVTNNGIHFEQDGIGVYIEGTSTGAVAYDFLTGDFPTWLETGVEYHVQFDNDNPDIIFQIYTYNAGGQNVLAYNSSSSGVVTFSPDYNATIRMRIRINAANVTVNKTFYPSITPTLTNSELEIALDTISDAANANINKAFKGEILVNSTSQLTDFNNAIINRYYSINVIDIANQPIAEKGHLLYFGINGGESTPLTGRAVQIFITNTTYRFFYRLVRFGSPVTWSEWEEVSINSYTSLSMFESAGIIGDSFASGEIYVGNNHDDYYNLSWPQIMGRTSGISVTNYSEGALTSKTWLTDTDHGKTAMDADTAKQCYIVALGINDARIFGPGSIGTSADLSPSSTADTFYKYMGDIRRAIHTHAPNAIIFWSTIARFGNSPYPYDDYSAAIKAIAQNWADPVLDLTADGYFKSGFFAANQVSSHPTAVTYSGMAAAYKRLIERYMQDNPAKFASFTG